MYGLATNGLRSDNWIRPYIESNTSRKCSAGILLYRTAAETTLGLRHIIRTEICANRQEDNRR